MSNNNREWVINAHRGSFKSGILENSAESFTLAAKEGGNCLECDLHITKDNRIILIHNGDIDYFPKLAVHIPDESEFHEVPLGNVNNHSFAFIKSVKFQNNAEILSFSEYLEVLIKLHMGANIELKESGYEDLILKEIEQANIDYDDLLGPVVCTSSNPFAILKILKLTSHYKIPLYKFNQKKGLAVGLQAKDAGSFYGKWMLRQCGKRNIWGFMTHYRWLPINRIEYAHNHGVKFCPRVPDDVDLINRYIDGGVDGFETDNVPLIRKCIEEKGYELWALPK